MSFKIYHNPRCSKSRQALELLKSHEINPEIILYLENPLNFAEITELLKMLNAKPRDIIRKKESEYLEQNLKDESLSDAELITAITNSPKLLERPIITNKTTAVIGHPTENILKLF